MTSFIPSPVAAEHSMYLCAPIRCVCHIAYKKSQRLSLKAQTMVLLGPEAYLGGADTASGIRQQTR
jgi:hypothetical protein